MPAFKQLPLDAHFGPALVKLKSGEYIPVGVPPLVGVALSISVYEFARLVEDVLRGHGGLAP